MRVVPFVRIMRLGESDTVSSVGLIVEKPETDEEIDQDNASAS